MQKPSNWRVTLPALFFFAALPNLSFLVADRFFLTSRPAVNVDYLLVGMAAPLLGPWVTGALFFAATLNEVIVNAAPIYHFELFDAFLWIFQLRYLHGAYAAVAAGLVGLGALALAIPAALAMRDRRRAVSGSKALAVPFLLLSLVAIALGGGSVAYSAFARTASGLHFLLNFHSHFLARRLEPSEGATGELLARLNQGKLLPKGLRVVVVVVESFGTSLDRALNQAIEAPLLDPAVAERYALQQSDVAFHGHTMDAEFRELCGVRLMTYGELSLPKCLPGYFRERGYPTVAFHGFTGEFYDRRHWYPAIGFDREIFAEELGARLPKKECGSVYRGYCDAAVAELIHQELLVGPPKLVYWMTLNSHLPLDEAAGAESRLSCQVSEASREVPEICRLAKTVHLVMQDISRIALDPALPPTEFILVGDHSPPFLERTKDAYFSQSVVPALTLRPKAGP